MRQTFCAVECLTETQVALSIQALFLLMCNVCYEARRGLQPY